jgi:phosphatidate cytidylyltransferase
MTDDRNNDQSGGGFDDWLDDEPGPVTDPYTVLPSEATDDPDSIENTSQDDTEEITATGGDSMHNLDDESDEVEVTVTEEATAVDPEDETEEIEMVPSAAPMEEEEDETVEIEAFSNLEHPTGESAADPDDDDDTGELEVFPPAGVDQQPSTETADPHLEKSSAIGFGDLWNGDDDEDSQPSPADSASDVFDMTQEDYLHTATKEHLGLAESVALADEEDTEQVALAAPIPGLDATVVGFDDVVEAEGHGRVRARASGDLVARVITAIVLIAALGAALLWQPALVALALGVFLLGAGEFYTALLRSDRKPIALFGFVGITAASLGAYFSGALWIPLAFLVVAAALLLFYAVVPGKVDPMANLALTITVMVWAGLGSFAMLIAKSDSYRTLVLGVVVTVAAMDIAQYFFGRALGRHKLSPWVSPKKTIEGLLAGVVVALTIGALLHFFPPFELTSGLAVGAAVAVFAPVGDLAMSAAKRSLGLKDMGSVLPGHGGFLDRIDGLLFVIPVAWAIFLWAGIL